MLWMMQCRLGERTIVKTIVVLALMEGGTTLALHWAVEAEAKGKRRVILVDVDPQGSAAAWFKRRQVDTPSPVQTSGGKVAPGY
jgi:cellulose biosynthesis protein BcsQ